MKVTGKLVRRVLVVLVVVMCLLCVVRIPLLLYVYPQVPESLAEDIRREADQLREARRADPDKTWQTTSPGEKQWPPAIKSLQPTDVFVYDDEVYVFCDDVIGLHRGIVIVPDKIARTGPGGEKEYHYLSHRVYRFVIWWD